MAIVQGGISLFWPSAFALGGGDRRRWRLRGRPREGKAGGAKVTVIVDSVRGRSAHFGLELNMTKQRRVLVILSNRLNRFQKSRFVELECDSKGNILKETALRAEPRRAVYDEVWENDEGRTSLSSCYRIKRRYRHPLTQSST